eukprot:11298507-Ditylum_brightwellii.AAC.1
MTSIQSSTDSDGRQCILFFLKTVESQEKVVESARFVNGYRPVNKMDEDNQNDDDVVDSNVSHLRGEVEEYVINMKAEMKKSLQNQDMTFD